MDVYRQAARIVAQVRRGEGTAKALCLEKEVQKKKQTYAVVCESLRRYDALRRVLEVAQFFEFYPLVDEHLALVLCYDALCGPGVKTRQHPAALAIVESLPYLREAMDSAVSSDETGVPVTAQKNNLEPKSRHTSLPQLPTYARVNTLIADACMDDIICYFRKRRRPEEHNEVLDDACTSSASPDKDVPNLIVLPPGTDLHKAKLFRNGSLVIQDKASCLPPCVLLGRVHVQSPIGSLVTPDTVFHRILDACAAPGNKTTHLAALCAESNGGRLESFKIFACERDSRRAATLRERLTFLGADPCTTVIEGDFTSLDTKVRSRVEAILLDPSCSASGMVKRIDAVQLLSELSSPSTALEGEEAHQRVEQLARMQEKLLVHALTNFARVKRVVYSTCSVHERENEDVIRGALSDPALSSEWKLAHIMPDGQWLTRGLPSRDDCDIPTEFCIRCDPSADRTNGFFVACLDRVAAS